MTTAGQTCRDTAGTLQGRPADYEGDVGEVEDRLPAPDVEEWPEDQRVEDHPHVGGCDHRSPSELLHKEKLDETSQLILLRRGLMDYLAILEGGLYRSAGHDNDDV